MNNLISSVLVVFKSYQVRFLTMVEWFSYFLRGHGLSCLVLRSRLGI